MLLLVITHSADTIMQAKLFDKCWDSPDVCNSKQNGTLSVSRLGINDILFLEVLVRRYVPKDAPAKDGGGYWSRGWKTSLELHRIFRMLKAPSDAPVEPDSENELANLVDDD